MRNAAMTALTATVLVCSACGTASQSDPSPTTSTTPRESDFFQVRPVQAETPVSPTASGSSSSGAAPGPVESVSGSSATRTAPASCPTARPKPEAAASACDVAATSLFQLGPAFLTGRSVLSASAQLIGAQPTVIITLDENAATQYLDQTADLDAKTSPQNQVAILAGPRVVAAFEPETGLFKGEISVDFSSEQAAADFVDRVNDGVSS